MSVTARVRRWVHHDCQSTFAQLDQMHERLEEMFDHLAEDLDQADSARAESEAAHHDAEVELAAARERNEALEAELSRVRARADQAEAARAGAEKLLTSPLPLTRPSLQGQGPVDAALLNVVLIRILVRNEANRANRDEDSFYGEHLHQLADVLQARIIAAHGALRTDPERVLEDLQDPLLRTSTTA